MKNVIAIIDGKKFYLVGAGLVVLAFLKVIFDIPFIDNLEVFDVTEAGDLFSLGVLTILGRSTIAKFEPEKKATKAKKK